MTNVPPTSHTRMHEPKARDWNLTMGFVMQMDPWKCHHFLNYRFLEKAITDKAVIYKEGMSEALKKLETMNTNHSLWSKINTHICLKETREPTCTVCLHTQAMERQESIQWTAAAVLLLSTTLQEHISTCSILQERKTGVQFTASNTTF